MNSHKSAKFVKNPISCMAKSLKLRMHSLVAICFKAHVLLLLRQACCSVSTVKAGQINSSGAL